MKISIIIPTLNEEVNISNLLAHLNKIPTISDHEIIVSDGMSSDNTIARSKEFGVTTLALKMQSRAVQMNKAAQKATGDILYFVHADTLPPLTCIADIQNAIDKDACVGCFRFRFNSDKLVLKLNSYFTRFDLSWCRGGDQSLFVKRSVFEELGAFDESCVIMEDFEFINRARKKYPFSIIPKDIIVSARKYESNSYLKVQLANLIAFRKFKNGVPHADILKRYRSMLVFPGEQKTENRKW